MVRQVLRKGQDILTSNYFMSQFLVERKEVTIEYCSTDEMMADFFVKPLVGNKFGKEKKKIMNNTVHPFSETAGVCLSTKRFHGIEVQLGVSTEKGMSQHREGYESAQRRV